MKPVALHRPDPHRILRVAADAVGCTVAALRAPDRRQRISFCRAVAMQILQARGHLTHSEIGRLLRRNRSTVTYDLRRLEDLVQTDCYAGRLVSAAAFTADALLGEDRR